MIDNVLIFDTRLPTDSYRDLGNTKLLQTRADVCEIVAIR
jgi:hypothetical protein